MLQMYEVLPVFLLLANRAASIGPNRHLESIDILCVDHSILKSLLVLHVCLIQCQIVSNFVERLLNSMRA